MNRLDSGVTAYMCSFNCSFVVSIQWPLWDPEDPKYRTYIFPESKKGFAVIGGMFDDGLEFVGWDAGNYLGES